MIEAEFLCFVYSLCYLMASSMLLLRQWMLGSWTVLRYNFFFFFLFFVRIIYKFFFFLIFNFFTIFDSFYGLACQRNNNFPFPKIISIFWRIEIFIYNLLSFFLFFRNLSMSCLIILIINFFRYFSHLKFLFDSFLWFSNNIYFARILLFYDFVTGVFMNLNTYAYTYKTLLRRKRLTRTWLFTVILQI
jgi:hypothetical protein